ncbi:hypothetical protein O9992_02370 [Vibrio lentus]|nr:hypothetical protein [Vibrio lentus]
MAYLTAKSRPMSDKRRWAPCRLCLDNEDLRISLRLYLSSTTRIQSVKFVLAAVYQHLRERIRQDIIHTDDPVEAIEEMEVGNSARSTEELDAA